ncbi:free fatty acid receptor 4-like [Hemibagrus wyckioides]|uniref:free fatty acid receptor 4-like n=1 Tax=Hemibagrus wyckioides TaxID=337641 RepID=UPI00266D5F9B|nr:free fatty acid receptor 4-like [Hemibagrus wyckioides]
MMLLLMEPTSHLHVQNFSHFTCFSELQDSYWLVPVIETMVLLILFLVSVVGNIGAIVLVIQERRLANTSILIMNLFLADLLFVSTVPFVISVRWTKAWKLGSAACHLILYSISVSGVVTSTTLAGISIERLLAILKMKTTPSLNPRLTHGVLFLIWFLCAVAMLPLSLFSRVITVSSPQQAEMHICALIWPHIKVEIVWYAVFLGLGFLVPGSSIVICYTKILQIKQRSQRRLHLTTSHRQAQSSAVSKQDYKLFRTLLILMISFFIMWSPIFIFTFLILIHNIQAHLPITSSTFVWVLTFTMANSALNPVLYSLCQLKHRWKRLCCATAITPGQRAVTQ